MELYKVKSLDELKTLGKHKDIAAHIKEVIGKETRIKTRSWQDLYETVCNNRELLKNKLLKNNKRKTKKQYNSQYFISKEAEIIFYLIELDGESRLKRLGITKSYYNNKKKAIKWRNDLAKLIHPDKCFHLNAVEATSKLNSIYNEMIGNEE